MSVDSLTGLGDDRDARGTEEADLFRFGVEERRDREPELGVPGERLEASSLAESAAGQAVLGEAALDAPPFGVKKEADPGVEVLVADGGALVGVLSSKLESWGWSFTLADIRLDAVIFGTLAGEPNAAGSCS